MPAHLKYKPEYAEKARKLALLGATNDVIGDFFGVTRRTITVWRDQFPEFGKALREGKMEADSKVAEKLYQRALGYEHMQSKPFYDKASGGVIVAEYRERFPPDTNAASLWLRNRHPGLWRDKHEVEHTGKDGEALFREMTEDELVARLMSKRAAKDKADEKKAH